MHLTATNTGITAAIDRDGRVLGAPAAVRRGRLEVRAQGYAGATPYVRWRDWPVARRLRCSCSRLRADRAAQISR